MKLKALFPVLFIVILSCKEEELSELEKQQNKLLSENGWNDNTNNFEFPVYYSKIDTVHLYQVSDKYSSELTFRYIEDDSVTIKVLHNDAQFSDYKQFDFNHGDLWERRVVLDFSKSRLKNGDRFSAEVNYKGKNYKYYLTAIEKPIHTDVLGVKFGYSQEEVKRADLQRIAYYPSIGLGSGFVGDSAVLHYTEAPRFLPFGLRNWSTQTHYFFENGKLVSVIEDCVITQNGSTKEEVLQHISEISKTLGNTESIEIDGSGKLKKQIKWFRNGVFLSVVESVNRGFDGENKPIAIGIKYSLKE